MHQVSTTLARCCGQACSPPHGGASSPLASELIRTSNGMKACISLHLFIDRSRPHYRIYSASPSHKSRVIFSPIECMQYTGDGVAEGDPGWRVSAPRAASACKRLVEPRYDQRRVNGHAVSIFNPYLSRWGRFRVHLSARGIHYAAK